jgi:hypothetical protein
MCVTNNRCSVDTILEYTFHSKIYKWQNFYIKIQNCLLLHTEIKYYCYIINLKFILNVCVINIKKIVWFCTFIVMSVRLKKHYESNESNLFSLRISTSTFNVLGNLEIWTIDSSMDFLSLWAFYIKHWIMSIFFWELWPR